MTPPVRLEEARDPSDRFFEIVLVREEDHAEVIRVRPVEARALHQQHVLRLEQLEDEGLVVLDRIDLRVEARE